MHAVQATQVAHTKNLLSMPPPACANQARNFQSLVVVADDSVRELPQFKTLYQAMMALTDCPEMALLATMVKTLTPPSLGRPHTVSDFEGGLLSVALLMYETRGASLNGVGAGITSNTLPGQIRMPVMNALMYGMQPSFPLNQLYLPQPPVMSGGTQIAQVPPPVMGRPISSGPTSAFVRVGSIAPPVVSETVNVQVSVSPTPKPESKPESKTFLSTLTRSYGPIRKRDLKVQVPKDVKQLDITERLTWEQVRVHGAPRWPRLLHATRDLETNMLPRCGRHLPNWKHCTDVCRREFWIPGARVGQLDLLETCVRMRGK